MSLATYPLLHEDRGGQKERIFEEAEAALNGLFTNDKFCLSRPVTLCLTWSRRPLRARAATMTYSPHTRTSERTRRGGPHAPPMASLSPDAPIARRAAPVEPGVPTARGVDRSR